MPPVNAPSSRAGLITAVVAFTILFVTATIFAIYYGVQDSKAEAELATMKKTNSSIIADPSRPEVQDLVTNAKSNLNLPEQTAMQEAIYQRDQAVKMITGSAATTQPADQAVKQTTEDVLGKAAQVLDDANKKLAQANQVQLASESDNLAGAVNSLSDEVAALSRQLDQQQAANTEAAKQAQAQIQAAQAQVTALNQQLQAAQAGQTEKVAASTADLQKKDAEIADLQKTMSDALQKGQDALKAADTQRATYEATIAANKKQIDSLQNRLSRNRVSVADPIVRQADAQIVRVSADNVVYINLGQGDHITKGMTFEVYDKNQPLPSLGDGLSDDNMPTGKGSIEVINIGADSSECQIIKQQPGMTISEGDPIMNLVYDRNVKYNFYVYGDFDTDLNGVWTPQEADNIKRLIVQWGGKVTNQLNVDTDFVVMGKEPSVPNYTDDELRDPFNKKRFDDAKAALDAYQDVVKHATDLHIPIMNQNRFFYFTGYFDMAGK